MARNHQPRDDVKRAEDIDRALELRRDGRSQRAIAAVMKCSLGRVQDLLAEGLAAIPAENAEAVRSLELERLDQMLEGLARPAQYSDKGKLISGGMCDGEPTAVQAAVKIMDRRAKLLGLDAPTKVHAEVNDVTKLSGEEIEKRQAEILARTPREMLLRALEASREGDARLAQIRERLQLAAASGTIAEEKPKPEGE